MMGAGNYVHRLLGTMIGLCGDELLWKVHKKCFRVRIAIDNVKLGFRTKFRMVWYRIHACVS